MYSFYIYCLLTTLVTFYFFYSLYLKENQIFVFTIYIVKSKFYFCLLVNFGLMVLIIMGKMIIKLFFGEVRLSEMIQVIEKIRMKFITFLLLFLTFRPTIDISKILVVVVYHCMSILNMLSFKRSAYVKYYINPIDCIVRREIKKSTCKNIINLFNSRGIRLFFLYINKLSSRFKRFFFFVIKRTSNEF